LPFLTAMGSRLAEIGVRTTFVIMTSIATLLFYELDKRLIMMAKTSVYPEAFSGKILQKCHDVDHERFARKNLKFIAEKKILFLIISKRSTDFSIN